MLDLLELSGKTKREDSASNTPEEMEFATIYFSYYPYLVNANN